LYCRANVQPPFATGLTFPVKLPAACMLPPLNVGAANAVAAYVAVASVVLPDSAASGVAGIAPESRTSDPLLDSAHAAASATDAVFCAVFMGFPSGNKKPAGWRVLVVTLVVVIYTLQPLDKQVS